MCATAQGEEELEHHLHWRFRTYGHHSEWFALPANWTELLPNEVDFTFYDYPLGFPPSCVLGMLDHLVYLKAKNAKSDDEARRITYEAHVMQDQLLRNEKYSLSWHKALAAATEANDLGITAESFKVLK